MNREYVLGALLGLSGVGALTVALMIFRLYIGYMRSRHLWGWLLGDLPPWSIVPLFLLGLLAIACGNSYRERSTTESE